MIWIKLAFAILSMVSLRVHASEVKSSKLLRHHLDSRASQLIGDLIPQESGKAVVFAGKKEDIVAKKGFAKGGKIKLKKLDAGGKKLGKKFGQVIGKKLEKQLIKKDKKAGAFGALKKGYKKLAKVKAFSKIAGSGYKKKSFNVKTFNENKAFKFGKTKGFKLAKGVAAGVAKKGAKFKKVKVDGLKKKLKGGKKEFLDLKLLKGKKKLKEIKKVGVEKGGKKFLKKKIKGGKKLKKIG